MIHSLEYMIIPYEIIDNILKYCENKVKYNFSEANSYFRHYSKIFNKPFMLYYLNKGLYYNKIEKRNKCVKNCNIIDIRNCKLKKYGKNLEMIDNKILLENKTMIRFFSNYNDALMYEKELNDRQETFN